MSQLILDMGSGNTSKNDKSIIETMIRQVADIATDRHEIIFKWQLFKQALPNVPLDHGAFEYAYRLANNLGFQTTSSVFDIESMRYLMKFDVPFVKIACNPDLYHLAFYSTVPVYMSTASSEIKFPDIRMMACVSKYPAIIDEYENTFTKCELDCISDHTVGWRLYKKYRPDIIEKHFVHVREEGNPDAGPFAVTQRELSEVM